MAKTTFIATGDSFITRPIPKDGYPGFQEIAHIIGQHDVRFNNLEITVHKQRKLETKAVICLYCTVILYFICI